MTDRTFISRETFEKKRRNSFFCGVIATVSGFLAAILLRDFYRLLGVEKDVILVVTVMTPLVIAIMFFEEFVDVDLFDDYEF